MLRNWLLGLFATGIWTANFLVYFWRDIRAWWRRRRDPSGAMIWRPAPRPPPPPPPPADTPDRLAPDQRHRFPPPEPTPHPVQDLEIRQ